APGHDRRRRATRDPRLRPLDVPRREGRQEGLVLEASNGVARRRAGSGSTDAQTGEATVRPAARAAAPRRSSYVTKTSTAYSANAEARWIASRVFSVAGPTPAADMAIVTSSSIGPTLARTSATRVRSPPVRWTTLHVSTSP